GCRRAKGSDVERSSSRTNEQRTSVASSAAHSRLNGRLVGRAAQPPVPPAAIEPVHVLSGGILDIVQAAPRPRMVDQLGLLEPAHGLGEGMVVAIAPRADGGHDA